MVSWRSKRVLAAGGAGLVVALGAGVGVAATQSGSAADSPKSFLSDVAGRVGVTPQALLDAMKAEAIERIDQAVADGRLDADRAARLKEGIQSGELPFFGAGMMGRHGPIPFVQTAADYLGMSLDELRSQLASGKSLAELADAKGKSVDGLVAAIVADAKARLDEAVAAGRLTDAQRDDALARIEERVSQLVRNTQIGPGLSRGFHGPFGDHFGPRQDAPPPEGAGGSTPQPSGSTV